MKIGSFDILAWTYRGQKLDPIWAIARRALALPLLWLGKALVFLSALAGWGLEDAKAAWRDLP